MNIILHRRNTIAELMATDMKYGVEIDIRSHGENLILHHEPYVAGEEFSAWLELYKHGTLILNVKEEGLEPIIINLMASKGIENYFFLDQSFPFLVKHSVACRYRSAVRVSEFESIETALNLTGRVNWVWVDCFTKFSLTQEDAIRLKNNGFKICLVSPELHGRNAEYEIPLLATKLREENINADAVCTKCPALWENEGLTF